MKHNRYLLLASFITMLMNAQAQQHPMQPVTFNTDTPFVHDPVMAYENGVYHLYYTGHHIGHMTSTDRHTWNVRREGLIEDIPTWTHDSVPGFRDHIWAPDIIRWKGRWWMAYSCSTFGKNTSAIGLLSTSSLSTDAWKDEGCLVASRARRDNWNAIDPAFVNDDRDSLWLAWGSFWDGIQLAPLTIQEGKLRLADYPRTIARRYYRNAPEGLQNPTSKHAGVNAIEAPFIMRHDGYYYLFVSWDYCCRGRQSNYRVVVGRSREVSGPYLDRQGVPMYAGGGTPVISGDGKEFEAAGHCAAYHIADGDVFLCHGYSIPLQGQSILIQRKITWEDGWPILKGYSTKYMKSTYY